ncbi:hypothetical protein CERSUDRAFT_93494 [Gelatoporia subvermispora B]|uniref:Uncharacterized protein n=1 Tax=Ceriporiopsis subvermispora (strain B) TaxID=914234 RepID=M2R0E4_CERS8|nr:hypothetical protein CERSUDRAFT_93494 [Gelatoporia subvermispora B]
MPPCPAEDAEGHIADVHEGVGEASQHAPRPQRALTRSMLPPSSPYARAAPRPFLAGAFQHTRQPLSMLGSPTSRLPLPPHLPPFMMASNLLPPPLPPPPPTHPAHPPIATLPQASQSSIDDKEDIYDELMPNSEELHHFDKIDQAQRTNGTTYSGTSDMSLSWDESPDVSIVRGYHADMSTNIEPSYRDYPSEPDAHDDLASSSLVMLASAVQRAPRMPVPAAATAATMPSDRTEIPGSTTAPTVSEASDRLTEIQSANPHPTHLEPSQVTSRLSPANLPLRALSPAADPPHGSSAPSIIAAQVLDRRSPSAPPFAPASQVAALSAGEVADQQVPETPDVTLKIHINPPSRPEAAGLNIDMAQQIATAHRYRMPDPLSHHQYQTLMASLPPSSPFPPSPVSSVLGGHHEDAAGDLREDVAANEGSVRAESLTAPQDAAIERNAASDDARVDEIDDDLTTAEEKRQRRMTKELLVKTHEALHGVDALFNQIATDLDIDSEKFRASDEDGNYVISEDRAIVGQCWEEFKKAHHNDEKTMREILTTVQDMRILMQGKGRTVGSRKRAWTDFIAESSRNFDIAHKRYGFECAFAATGGNARQDDSLGVVYETAAAKGFFQRVARTSDVDTILGHLRTNAMLYNSERTVMLAHDGVVPPDEGAMLGRSDMGGSASKAPYRPSLPSGSKSKKSERALDREVSLHLPEEDDAIAGPSKAASTAERAASVMSIPSVFEDFNGPSLSNMHPDTALKYLRSRLCSMMTEAIRKFAIQQGNKGKLAMQITLLPWKTMSSTCCKERIVWLNWPPGVPWPGESDSKGIAILTYVQRQLLLAAIDDEDFPLLCVCDHEVNRHLDQPAGAKGKKHNYLAIIGAPPDYKSSHARGLRVWHSKTTNRTWADYDGEPRLARPEGEESTSEDPVLHPPRLSRKRQIVAPTTEEETSEAATELAENSPKPKRLRVDPQPAKAKSTGNSPSKKATASPRARKPQFKMSKPALQRAPSPVFGPPKAKAAVSKTPIEIFSSSSSIECASSIPVVLKEPHAAAKPNADSDVEIISFSPKKPPAPSRTLPAPPTNDTAKLGALHLPQPPTMSKRLLPAISDIDPVVDTPTKPSRRGRLVRTKSGRVVRQQAPLSQSLQPIQSLPDPHPGPTGCTVFVDVPPLKAPPESYVELTSPTRRHKGKHVQRQPDAILDEAARRKRAAVIRHPIPPDAEDPFIYMALKPGPDGQLPTPPAPRKLGQPSSSAPDDAGPSKSAWDESQDTVHRRPFPTHAPVPAPVPAPARAPVPPPATFPMSFNTMPVPAPAPTQFPAPAPFPMPTAPSFPMPSAQSFPMPAAQSFPIPTAAVPGVASGFPMGFDAQMLQQFQQFQWFMQQQKGPGQQPGSRDS